MSDTKEVVLVPPTPADISNFALITDVQYLEPMGSEALNRKFLGIVARGIYRGYLYSLPGGMKLRIGAANNPGTVVVERDGACITVQQMKPVDLTVAAGFTGYVVVEAIYGLGVITKQVSTISTIDAAQIKLVTKAQLLPHHVILYAVTAPAGLTELKPTHVNASERMEVDLAGSTSIDGGRFVGTPAGCKVVQVRRGLATERPNYQLLDGELGVTTDDGRLTVGHSNRPGGTLQPAAQWAEASGATAKPQGAYLFGKAGVLQLPSSGVEVGEHVRVRVAATLVAAKAVCQVKVAGGAAISTRAGDALAINVDVSAEMLFIKTATGWGC